MMIRNILRTNLFSQRSTASLNALSKAKVPGYSKLFMPKQMILDQTQLCFASTYGNVFRYPEMFQFIKKNRILPEKIAGANTEKCQALLQAIHSGNGAASIYHDPECYIYLLMLMKEGRITHQQGITTYYYLLAVSQFSNKDKQLTVKQYRMFKDDVLTTIGEYYVKKLILHASILQVTIDEDDFIRHMLAQPQVEQMLIAAPLLNDNSHAANMTSILLHNLPTLIPDADTVSESKHFIVPSSTVMDYFLKQVNSKPFERTHVFGSLGFEKLINMHLKKQHPVAIFAKDVKSNLVNADSYICGPLLIALHDEGHTYWASLLSDDDHHYINNTLVPLLQKLIEEAQEKKMTDVVAKLRNVLNNVYDYNLTPVNYFKDPETRCVKYLARTFATSIKEKERSLYSGCSVFDKIATCAEDHVYYMLCQSFYQGMKKDNKLGAIIANIRDHALKLTSLFKQRLLTLELLAKNSVNAPEHHFGLFSEAKPAYLSDDEWQLKLQHVLQLLHHENDAKKLWKFLIDEPHCLYKLAMDAKLNVFEPFVPVTEVEKSRLIYWIQNKITSFDQDKKNNLTI